MQKPTSFMRSVSAGLVAGFLGGQLFFVVGLLRYGDELFALSHPGFLTTWILIRSVALYGLLGAATGTLLATLLHVAFAAFGRGRELVFPLVFSVSVATTAVAYLTAWRQIEVYVGLPFSYPGRMRSFSIDVLTSLALGAVSLLLIVWLRRKLARPERRDVVPRLASTVLLVSVAALFASDYALRLKEPLVDSPAGSRRLLVVGVDAGSLRVMGPMMRAGELPTFAKFVDEGAWGTFLAYGTAFSPIQWTSMATGKKVEDHGIYDFVAPKEGTSEARLLTSRDRKVEAVWHMLGQQGFRVGVIDWLMTYPPEEVNGYMISRLHTAESNRAYPEALEPAVELAAADREEFGDRARNRLLGEIDLLFELAARLSEIDPVDVQMMFEAATDEAGHNFWKYHEPTSFDPDLWEVRPQDVDRYGSVISDTYRLIDRRLGELLDTLSDDTLVLVVSDHGQRASLNASMWFGVDQVLAAMEELEFAHPDSREDEGAWLPEVSRQGQEVDFESTRAYSALAVAGSMVMGIKVNLEGREPTGTVRRDEADAFIEALAARLRGIRFENGDPLFGLVSTKPIDDDAGGSAAVDITLQHSEFTRGASALDAALSGRKVIIDDQTFPLSRFIATDVGVSGRHERSGVIFVGGKGVRRGFIGQTVTTTAVQALFRHLTDKLSVADTALPVLRRLEMIDRATTLDVTPTMLYALGVPIGEDMAGRPLTDVIVAPTPRWIASYDDPNRVRAPVGEGDADEELLKRLRALGYIR